MDTNTVTYSLTHADLIATTAKFLGLEPSQIVLRPVTAEEGSAVECSVTTDLATCVKIERKLKKLHGSEPVGA